MGSSVSGKTALLQRYLSPSSPFTRLHTATTTTTFHERRLATDGGKDVTLMIWDLPAFELMYPPEATGQRGGAGKDPAAKHSALFLGIGAIALVLDLFNEKFDLREVGRILARIKREAKGRVPPVTVVFNKWDLVDRSDEYGFDVKALYDAVFELLDDELTPNGEREPLRVCCGLCCAVLRCAVATKCCDAGIRSF